MTGAAEGGGVAELLLTALLTGLFAGLVAILATSAIEKLGGALGGLLGSSPTTVVPGSIGFALRLGNTPQLTGAMFIICVGMCARACVCVLMRGDTGDVVCDELRLCRVSVCRV
jgi:hypothetical protein